MSDSLRLHDKQHAYLRATHLDPSIGIEIECLAGSRPGQQKQPSADVEELESSLASSRLVCDQLKGENAILRAQLQEAKRQIEQLEQERETHLMSD